MSGAGDDEALINALLSAFDKRHLSSLMRFKAGIVLEEIVNVDLPLRRVVEDLVVELGRNGEVDRLLSLALRERGGNSLLRSVGEARGVQPLPAPTDAAQADGAAQGSIDAFLAAALKSRPDDPQLRKLAEHRLAGGDRAAGAGLSAPLEAQVARRSELIDFGRFRRRMDQLEQRICFIRTPQKLGTGFLVGPAHVLTNYHVVDGLLRDEYAFSTVECRFDFNSDTAEPQRVGLSATALSSAPYGASDLSGEGEPAPGELDYALLPLATPVGEDRGWYALDPLPRVVALQDFLFVCQHANGNQLQLAFGTVVEFPGNASRLRYDTTTAGGASGSPCLTPELDLVGLHHAADPDSHPRYNQGVPIWLVAAHARDAGVQLAAASGT
jgi:hypothetical protein